MSTFKSFPLTIGGAIVLSAMLGLGGCGGGGGYSSSGGGTMPPPPANGTIGGTAVKGPVNGGTVTAYAITGGTMGSQIATAKTDASGNFSISIGTYTGPVMLQLSGGTYTDEGTGTSMTMMSGDVMTAVLSTVSAGAAVSGIQLTPLTAMAQVMAHNMSGGMTDANIAAANTNVGKYFAVADILHNVPMNPLNSSSGSSAAQDQINYGMVLAGMSQYAQIQGMSSSSAMVTAMMNDASDGVMDGMMSGSAVMMGGMSMGMSLPPTAGTKGLATAMATFMASTQNHSGVTASNNAGMQNLMTQLNGSNGQMMSGGTALAGMVSGRVFNGAMSHGMVAAFAVTSGTQGMQIASTAMNPTGAFSMPLGTYAGPVMLQVTGGSFMDEATGKTMNMGASDTMTAIMNSVKSGDQVSGICITALTSMAQAHAAGMSGGMIDADITAANTAVGSYFDMTGNLLTTQPIDMTMAGSGTASGVTQNQMNYGAAIAAMSQSAMRLGMTTTSSAFVTSMMKDASDGMMDGMMGSAQIQMGGGMMGGMGMMSSKSGTSDLASDMTNFMDSSTMNHSGLTSTNVNALISKLAASNGQL